MKIELTQEEVKQAIEAWARRKLRLKGPVKVKDTGYCHREYVIETDKNKFKEV